MLMDPKIFKANDIRGIYPRELDESVAFDIGRAFVTLVETSEVIVGRDMRPHNSWMMSSLAFGANLAGANVLDIGEVSIDQLYYICADMKLPGIMVTASHNPVEYTGFKMVKSMPECLTYEDGIKELYRIIAFNLFRKSMDKGWMKLIDEEQLMSNFVSTILDGLDIDAIQSMNIVSDAGGGAVKPIIKTLRNWSPPIKIRDISVKRGPNPLTDGVLDGLKHEVSEQNADFGVAFDWDGDRVVFVDDRAEVVRGDFMAALIAEYMLEKYPKSKVICTLRDSMAVRDWVRLGGGEVVMERVGHAYIKQRMKDEDALFAGELSGHYYFRDFFYADSGILPALIVAEMLAKKDYKLSGMLAPIKENYFVSDEINIAIDGSPQVILDKVEAVFGEQGTVDKSDGLFVDEPYWRFSLRESNTEPVLRLNVEATSQTLMEEKRDEVLNCCLSAVELKRGEDACQ